jgi:hypothetical protein
MASLATLRWTNQSLIPSVVLSSSIILMPAAYIAAVNNLHEYQNAVQTMINLGRPGLAKKFGLQLPVSNSSEREMWQALSGLVQHRGPQEDYDQVLAPYRIPIPMTDPNE